VPLAVCWDSCSIDFSAGASTTSSIARPSSRNSAFGRTAKRLRGRQTGARVLQRLAAPEDVRGLLEAIRGPARKLHLENPVNRFVEGAIDLLLSSDSGDDNHSVHQFAQPLGDLG